MNPHQEYLFMMLKEIDSICKKNDIQYFIAQGTLLGAKRNEGFLPWDDDADITMTCENYEKFKEACARGLPANRALCAPEIDESCRISIPRYTSLDTTSFHTGQSLHDGMPAGEVIDIFVLDPIADGQEALDAYRANVCMVHDMANYSSTASNRYDVPFETFQKYAAIREEKGLLAVCRQLDEEKKALFDSNGSRYAYRWQGVITCYSRSWFDHAVPVMFEGHEFPGPCGANEYLSHYFGPEWSELPGVINAAKHNAALSLDFPYTEALQYYKPSQDRAAILAEMVDRKRILMKKSATGNWLKDETMRMRAKCISLEVEKHLDKHREQFDAAYEAKDGVALAALLADYLSAQKDRELMGRRTYGGYRRYRNPVAVDVPDKVLEAALIACMHTKRLTLASRLLYAHQQAGAPLNEAMSEVSDQLDCFSDAVNDFQYGSFDACLAKARQLYRRDQKVSAYLKLVCLAEQQLDGASAEFKSAVDEGLQAFPDEGFFVKLQADYLDATGQKEEAHNRYIVAAENSRNGFALHDIQRKTGYCPKWMRESAWGKAYGLPQWDGPVPDCTLPSAPKIEVEGPISVQEYLYQLLIELTDLCDKNGIEYALGKEAASALIQYGMQPDKVNNYSILVSKEGIGQLAAAVEHAGLPSRSFESKANNSDLGNGVACYHGEDSLYLRMGSPKLGKFNSLGIAVKAMGANERVSAVQRVLRKLGLRSKEKAFVRTVVFEDKVSGHSFKVAEGENLKGKKPKASLVLGGNDIVSTVVGEKEFLAAYTIAPDYFEKRREMLEDKNANAASRKHFVRNFKELKYAVQYKQLLHDLLPQKERILQLQASGDTEALAAVLAPYKKFTKDYKGCGEMSIDAEIYAALNSLK